MYMKHIIKKIRIFALVYRFIRTQQSKNTTYLMKKLFALLAVASAFTMANAQEIAGVKYDDGIAKKWELKFDGGYTNDFRSENYDNGLLEGGESWGATVGVGYNFTSNWFVGLNSGYWYRWAGIKSEHHGHVVPALLDVVYRWNLGNTEKWSLFLEGRGGYLFNLQDDFKFKGKDREAGNFLYADAQAGVYYRIRRNIDLKFALGWGYGFDQSEDVSPAVTHDEHPFSARVGMNLRGKPSTLSRAALLEEAARLAAEAEAARLKAEEAARLLAEAEAKKNNEAAAEAARLAAEKAAAEAAAAELAARAAATNLVFFYNIRVVNFDAEDDSKLQELVKYVNNDKVKMIYIKGYADRGTGNPYVNRKYAKQRAENVKKALTSKYGIDPKMIECMSYGDTVQPYPENDKNRCATIFVEFE